MLVYGEINFYIWVLTPLLMANSAAGDNLTQASAYLVTSPNSVNKTFVHIINSSESDQSFRGNLFRADGQRLNENAQLHNGFRKTVGCNRIERSGFAF